MKLLTVGAEFLINSEWKARKQIADCHFALAHGRRLGRKNLHGHASGQIMQPNLRCFGDVTSLNSYLVWWWTWCRKIYFMPNYMYTLINSLELPNSTPSIRTRYLARFESTSRPIYTKTVKTRKFLLKILLYSRPRSGLVHMRQRRGSPCPRRDAEAIG